MNKLPLVLLMLILVSGTAQAGKGEGGTTSVGNGGYAFRCTQDDPLRNFDFYKTQTEMGKDFKVSPVTWHVASLERISALITAKLPAMSYSFDKFVQQIGNQDPLLQYVWTDSPPWNAAPLFAEYDRVASICSTPSGEILGFYTQVILRKPLSTSKSRSHEETQVIFYLDQSTFDDLPEVDQSFLLVHEWLWNFTSDTEANRKADYLLHSTWFDHASSKQAIARLKKLGIRYP